MVEAVSVASCIACAGMGDSGDIVAASLMNLDMQSFVVGVSTGQRADTRDEQVP